MKSLLPLAAFVFAASARAGEPLSALPPRGTVQAADQLPILPAGAPALLSTTAGALQAYVRNYPAGIRCDGVDDDTAAIQAAIATGASFDLPPGVCVISATLALTTAASHGQVIRGAGATAADGTGSGKTVIRPTSAVTDVFLIDGTPFGGYLQSWGIEDLTLDMANMADTATSYGFRQVQAYDGSYGRVRVVNDGANKRAWLFNAGAYTTTLSNTQGNILDFEGLATNNGVTTINVMSHDGAQVIGSYAGNLHFIGGAFQGAATKFKFRNYCFGIYIQTDVEGSGAYLDVDNTLSSLYSNSVLLGNSGTYMIGTPGQSTVLLDQQVNYNSYPFDLGVGGLKLNNQGVAGVSSFMSGAAAQDYQVILGRTGNDVLWGVASGSNDILPGTIAGDGVLTTLPSTSSLFLGGGDTPAVKITSAGFSTYGAGTLNQGSVFIQPATNGDSLVVYNAARTGLVDITTAATGAASQASFANGIGLIGYTDGFATQAWKIEGSTGVIQAGAQLYPGGGNTGSPVLTTAGGILSGNGNPPNTLGNNGDRYFRGDCVHATMTCTWHKESGAWAAID